MEGRQGTRGGGLNKHTRLSQEQDYVGRNRGLELKFELEKHKINVEMRQNSGKLFKVVTP